MNTENLLNGVENTLYIPLAARIYVSEKFPKFFYDEKALSLKQYIPTNSIANNTTELIIGEDNINDNITFNGTFFFNNLLAIGITAQSQAGIKNPIKTPTNAANILFLGIIFTNVSSDTYLSIIADISEPRNKKGNASKNIEIKTIVIFLIILNYFLHYLF